MWFGNRRFRVNDITDYRLQEIAELIGAFTKTTQGYAHSIGQAAYVDERLQVFDCS